MVTIKNYVPILRWKKAERDALAAIGNKERQEITPLFELIMPGPKRDKGDYNKILTDSKTIFENRLPSTIEEINKCCFDGSAYVDVHLVDGDVRAQTLKHILDSASGANVTLIPVTHIIPVTSTEADNTTRKIAIDYATSTENGLCIRIDRFNLNDENLPTVISDFIKDNSLDISNTDLLIDYGVVNGTESEDDVINQLSALPELNGWRSFILTSGAFPKDLSDIEKFSQKQLTRYDWMLWQALSKNDNLIRKPIYSDYTIQHPIFYGQIAGTNTSASIRYADDEKWEISRGEGLRNKDGAGHQQYPELAKLLIEQPYFKGADFSFGDHYIAERAKPNNKTGNPTTWLKAGINHHLTLAVQQNATIPEDK